MARTPLTPRLAVILHSEPARGYLPPTYTHHDLACAAYAVEEPTAAQLSAVRRAVARLVADGHAMRDTERFPGEGAGWHYRRPRVRDGRRYRTRNPTGVGIYRTPTPADLEHRAKGPDSLAEIEAKLKALR